VAVVQHAWMTTVNMHRGCKVSAKTCSKTPRMICSACVTVRWGWG